MIYFLNFTLLQYLSYIYTYSLIEDTLLAVKYFTSQQNVNNFKILYSNYQTADQLNFTANI